MTVAQKMGVPLGGGQGRGGMLQPKQTWRFRVRVINFGPIAGGLDITQQVESVTFPQIEFDRVEVNAFNSKGYFAGRHTFSPITLVVKDDVTNVVNKLVNHQQQKQLNITEQTGYLSGVNYKFTTLLETLDGGNDVVLDTWTLEGCFLASVERMERAYRESSYTTITMSISYDNATQDSTMMTTNPDFTPGVNIG